MAAERCQAILKTVEANCEKARSYREVVAQDLDADDGEARVAGAAAQGATSVMDRLTDAASKKADTLAGETSDEAAVVSYGSPADPGYAAGQQKVNTAFDEFTEVIQQQIKNIGTTVVPLTQRHAVDLSLARPDKAH